MASSEESSLTVGIDLGTATIVMAEARTREMITSKLGNRTTQAAVNFTDGETIVGEGAILQGVNIQFVPQLSWWPANVRYYI